MAVTLLHPCTPRVHRSTTDQPHNIIEAMIRGGELTVGCRSTQGCVGAPVVGVGLAVFALSTQAASACASLALAPPAAGAMQSSSTSSECKASGEEATRTAIRFGSSLAFLHLDVPRFTQTRGQALHGGELDRRTYHDIVAIICLV